MTTNSERRQLPSFWQTREGFTLLVFASFTMLVLVQLLWPSAMPMGLFEVWNIKGNPGQWIAFSWPVFVWGAGLTAVGSILSLNSWKENHNAEKLFGRNTVRSIMAGVFEEISFRWICFLSLALVAKLVNFLFFGFAGFGIPEWLQLNILGPIFNFLTLGSLHAYLVVPATWAIGAGILGANSKFKDGHKYLGLIGMLNSWVIGMFFFVLMFRYGLLASILVHFMYDFFIFFVRYIDMVVERAMGVSSDRPAVAVLRHRPRRYSSD